MGLGEDGEDDGEDDGTSKANSALKRQVFIKFRKRCENHTTGPIQG